MSRGNIDPEQLRWLVGLLRRPEVSVGSDACWDRPFMDGIRADYPGLDRSHDSAELVAGVPVPDRWIAVVILRGVQILLAAEGYEVLLLGGLEAPFIAVHRNLEPLAVRTIPPDIEPLFTPKLPLVERRAIVRAIDDASSGCLRIVSEVAKGAPMPADLFAERVWRGCRSAKDATPRPGWSAEDERRVGEYLALSYGRPRLEQMEMALALSERVITGKDKPRDRQIQATAAELLWRDLGAIEWAVIDAVTAARHGWLRVASLAIQEPTVRQDFLERTIAAMGWIGQDDPVDIRVQTGATTTRVYRFRAGERTLIDRQGGRRGRVH